MISPKIQEALDGARRNLSRFAAVSGLTITVVTAVLMPADSYAAQSSLPPGNLAEHAMAKDAIDCKKNWVSDGDTVNAYCDGKKTRIRLYCIDAPETSQGEWGKASGKYLEGKMGNRFKLIIQDTDQYGRSVGEIFDANDGRNLNMEMVGNGAAAVYSHYCDKRNDSHYYKAEEFAKNNGFGIWGVDDPLIQAPWEYRRLDRSQKNSFSP